MLRKKLKDIVESLKLPEAKDVATFDAASTSDRHREIIQNKPFLKRLYSDYYAELKGPVGPIIHDKKNICVEIGSGGGFVKEIIPGVVTSDISEIADIDAVFAAENIPFKKDSLGAILMLAALHHVRDAERFFSEAERCLVPGGVLAMIEPANTPWSRFIYRNFHHEVFDPRAEWQIKEKGRLSSANIALPWIVFFRDREKFERMYPKLKIKRIRIHTPFRQIASGGVSFRQLVPTFSYELVKAIEILLYPVSRYMGLYMTVEIKKLT